MFEYRVRAKVRIRVKTRVRIKCIYTHRGVCYNMLLHDPNGRQIR